MKRFFPVRRTLPVLLALLLLISLLPLSAGAASREDVRELIYDSVRYNEEIDLSEYSLPREELEPLFFTMKDNGELPWYARSFRLRVNDDDTVQTFIPRNLDPAVYDYELYEQSLRQIVSETIKGSMSQWQKALALHDYLITHCAYDEGITLHEGYDAIVKGTAVCSGYARAYQHLLTLAGIPCRCVSGNLDDPPGHGWNLVQIGSSWYHVDTTWDDSTPNVEGRVLHKYFLLTDDEIRALNHYGWETDLICNDTSMQQGYWRDLESPICPETNIHSFQAIFDRDSWTWQILSRDDVTGDLTSLYAPERTFVNIGAGSYTYPHFGLSLYNGRLYFSSMDTVYSMNTDGSDLQSVYWYDTYANDRAICGVFVDDGILSLSYRDHDYESITGERYDLGIRENRHEHHYSRELVNPTCESEGFTRYTCSCGDSYQERFVRATGHDYQLTGSKKPSLFRAGHTDYTCSDCGDRIQETIPRKTLSQSPLEVTLMVVGGLVLLLLRAGKKKTT